MSTREKNAPAKYGNLAFKPIGPLPDEEKFNDVTLNQASDADLVEALARRGYDVTAKGITPEVAQKRLATYEKKKAQHAKRVAKAAPGI